MSTREPLQDVTKSARWNKKYTYKYPSDAQVLIFNFVRSFVCLFFLFACLFNSTSPVVIIVINNVSIVYREPLLETREREIKKNSINHYIQ